MKPAPALKESFLAGGRGTSSTRSPFIDVELREVSRLFNSMDPSPLEDRDLDPSAEEFIVSSSEEHHADTPLTLRIFLEQWPANDPTELIRKAIHNYFAYRADISRLDFRRLMSRGRTSLTIGLFFLIGCLLASKVLLGDAAGTWAGIARESLTIAGWVAMWRPMEIYLYDWWPLKRRGRGYARLSEMPVEVIRKDGSERSAASGPSSPSL